jgi:cell wall-associated NlpC family hydrolase
MKACLALLALAVLPLHAETAKKKAAPSNPKTTATTNPDQSKEDPAAKKPTASTKAPPEKKVTKPDGKVTPPTEGSTPTEGKEAGKKSPHGQPAVIATIDLLDFDTLPEDRRKLIEGAIRVAKESPWLPYKFGGSSPADGGFDCSGAMFFVMNKAGLKPPRTSADQYLWVKVAGRLHETSGSELTLDHPSLAELKPGDLLFWEGTYSPSDGRAVNITHVAIYLGREKKDKRPVMINATDGRSYRGKQANGYGVYDFHLPKEGSRAKFAGFGTPPGIAELK